MPTFAIYLKVDGKWSLVGRRHGLLSAYKCWKKGYCIVSDWGAGVKMPATLEAD